MSLNFHHLAEAALLSKQRENEKHEKEIKEKEQINSLTAKRHNNALRRSATFQNPPDRRGSIGGRDNVQRKRRTAKTHDIRSALQQLDAEDIDVMSVGYSNANHGFNKLADSVQARNKSWLPRFGDRLDESMIIRPPLTAFEQAALDASKSRDIVRPPNPPVRAPVLSRQELNKFSDDRSRSNECFYCRLLVPIGAELVECRTCPMICHLRCCPDIRKYLKRPTTEAKSTKTTSEPSTIDQHADLEFSESKRQRPFRKDLLKLQSRSPSQRSKKQKQLSPIVSPKAPLSPKGKFTFLGGKLRPIVHVANFTREVSRAVDPHGDDPYWYLTGRDVEWSCVFCVQEVEHHNEFQDTKHQSELEVYRRVTGATKIQAAWRKTMWRTRFLTAQHGIILLQRVLRMWEIARRDELEKANERHPYRIRLHDVRLFVKEQDGVGLSTSTTATAVSAKGTIKGGSISMKTAPLIPHMLFPTPPFPLLPYPFVIGEMASMGFDKIFGEFKVTDPEIEEKDQNMVDLIASGHQDTPTFAKTFRSMQHVQAGTVFLTITVHEQIVYDTRARGEAALQQQQRRPMQIARYDLPLKAQQGKPLRIRPAFLEKLGYSLNDYSKQDLDLLLSRYRVATFSAQKPYILIPYSRANCEVKMTVSQVTDWPKAVIVGQSSYNVKRYIQRKRFLSISQGLLPCMYTDIPSTEDGCRINLVLPRSGESAGGMGSEGLMETSFNSSNSTGTAVGRRNSILRTSTSNSSGLMTADGERSEGKRGRRGELHQAKVVKVRSDTKNDKHIAEYSSGVITWTLMPMGYSENNEAGFLMQLNQETIDSTKKKCWCILIDKMLTIFSVVKESIKIKHTVDIRTTYVSLLEHDVIKLKAAVETLFLHCGGQKEHEKWFRKIYSQSMSQSVQPFHLYNKRKNNNAKPTEAEIEATMQGLMEGQLARAKSSRGGANAGNKNHLQLSRTSPMRTMTRSSYEEVELLDLQIQSFLDEMRVKYIENQAKNVDFRNPDDLKHHKTPKDYLDTLVSAVTSSVHRF